MTRKIEDMQWPGGEHDFALRFEQIEALQQRCDAGPQFILQALSDGSWHQSYIFQTIRLGLIGGGLDPEKAKLLVSNLKDDGPLRELSLTAAAILSAALVGQKDDPIGDMPGEGAGVTQQPQEENGDSHASTEREPSSVSRQETSAT